MAMAKARSSMAMAKARSSMAMAMAKASPCRAQKTRQVEGNTQMRVVSAVDPKSIGPVLALPTHPLLSYIKSGRSAKTRRYTSSWHLSIP
jgi:hypothetical protein